MTLEFASFAYAQGNENGRDRNYPAIQVGARPFYLVEGMDNGRLKDKLLSCNDGPFFKSDFSIGHRGAPLQFPEHTKESYQAAARMGAGIVETNCGAASLWANKILLSAHEKSPPVRST